MFGRVRKRGIWKGSLWAAQLRLPRYCDETSPYVTSEMQQFGLIISALQYLQFQCAICTVKFTASHRYHRRGDGGTMEPSPPLLSFLHRQS